VRWTLIRLPHDGKRIATHAVQAAKNGSTVVCLNARHPKKKRKEIRPCLSM
jgi:uncharacterized protein (DUF849 family)